MDHITYLLGAGASAKCLPVVSGMSASIEALAGEFERQLNRVITGHSMINRAEAKALIQDLYWLAGVCDTEKNFSVDTFAKKLLLSGKDDEYKKLKNILTLYFTLQQKLNSPDVRYDNFWASLLDSKDNFPENIKILSWNYDFQLELTYQDFVVSNSLAESSKRLNILTKKTISQDSKVDKFTVFKLNGSATYNSEVVKGGCNYILDNIKGCHEEEVVSQSMDYYIKSDRRSVVTLLSHLSYAWENNIEDLYYKKLEEALLPTTILVVIGYSFPYFNREIDKLTLNRFMPNLRKVYFQDNNPMNIKERFSTINARVNPIDLIPISDTYQFYLPNEL